MPKEDGVHNYHFGQLPEMPWKKEENKMKMDVVGSVMRDVSSEKYLIVFHHTYPTINRKFMGKRIKFGTVCALYPTLDFTDFLFTEKNNFMCSLAHFGKTYLHPNDDFDFREGEKRALERAVRLLNKQSRKDVWNAWLNNPPFPNGILEKQDDLG